jgi:transcription-repair coupling factor (superfamily II helicase)
MLGSHPGLDLDQLGAVDVLDEDTTLGEIEFATRPTLRFHGSIPAFIEQIRNLVSQEQRICSRRPISLRWSGWPTCCASIGCRIGSAAATRSPPARICTTRPPSRRRYARPGHCARADGAGVSCPEQNFILFGANDLSDDADVPRAR